MRWLQQTVVADRAQTATLQALSKHAGVALIGARVPRSRRAAEERRALLQRLFP